MAATPYRRDTPQCRHCAVPVDASECLLSWEGALLCDGCFFTQPPPLPPPDGAPQDGDAALRQRALTWHRRLEADRWPWMARLGTLAALPHACSRIASGYERGQPTVWLFFVPLAALSWLLLAAQRGPAAKPGGA